MFAIHFPGIAPDSYMRRGNAYPQALAVFEDRSEAQGRADKCPPSYRAAVVPTFAVSVSGLDDARVTVARYPSRSDAETEAGKWPSCFAPTVVGG